MKEIPLSESFFQGQISIENRNGWLKPWRVYWQKKALFPSPDDGLLGRMECASGIRLRFKTSSTTIALQVKAPEACRIDLTIGSDLVRSAAVTPEDEQIVFNELAYGEKIVEIWLPQSCGIEVKNLVLDDESDAELVDDKRLKWVTYGSSITHCVAAHSPARTWPATAARKHDLHLTSLGVGGQCHLEPMLGMMIRDLPADLITLKLGINVMGASSLNHRTFKSAIIGLIEIIREKHPETPIGVISPIISPPRETDDNSVGFSLQKMRIEVEDAVKRVIETDGDANLLYFSGLDIFGQELVGPRLPDDLHPDGDGYELMGSNVADKILPSLLELVRK